MDVSVVACNKYDEELALNSLRKCLDEIGGLDFVKSGMKIAIKANLVSFMKPEKAATTHPVLLSALTRLLTERGASVVIGDSPGGLYNAAFLNRVYSATGMHETEKHGATLNYDFSQKEATFEGAKKAKSFLYCFISEFLGSVRILTRASSSRPESAVITGNLPTSSGMRPYFTKSCGTN